MKLLTAVLPRVRRLVPSSERAVAVSVLAVVVALEILGRQATTEFHDALAGTALAAVGLGVLSYHRTRRLAWIDRLQHFTHRLANRFGQLKYDVGIDFRGTPPLPRKLPWVVPAAITGLVVWAALAFEAWAIWPDGWRVVGIHSSYVLYVLGLMVLWLALAACLIAGVFLPVTVVDQAMRRMSGDTAPGPPDVVVLAGYAVLAVLVACITPPGYAAGLCLFVVAFGAVGWAVGSADAAAILWRTSASSSVYAVPLRRVVAIGLVAGGLLVFGLLAWSCGGRLLTAPSVDAAMPLTGFLGAVVAWLVPGVVGLGVYQLLEFRRTDPARVLPPVVHLNGDSRAAAVPLIRRWGYSIAAPNAVKANAHVGLRLVTPEQSEATEFDPRWPLKVSVADLGTDIVQPRVARRDELQLRRQLFRGLAALLKRAKVLVPVQGGGFWLAPHWWFVGGLLWAEPDKDAEDDALRPVGPPFARLFPPRVRQYIYRVLRSAEVDSIYLEDGIGHRKLEKVLRTILELYDMHGGKRRAEEHHFKGIGKVRVMIHDYAPGQPFRASHYPEPKFDDVSRSRVLHVFKDRDEEEAREDVPFDFSWEPSPMAVW